MNVFFISFPFIVMYITQAIYPFCIIESTVCVFWIRSRICILKLDIIGPFCHTYEQEIALNAVRCIYAFKLTVFKLQGTVFVNVLTTKRFNSNLVMLKTKVFWILNIYFHNEYLQHICTILHNTSLRLQRRTSDAKEGNKSCSKLHLLGLILSDFNLFANLQNTFEFEYLFIAHTSVLQYSSVYENAFNDPIRRLNTCTPFKILLWENKYVFL